VISTYDFVHLVLHVSGNEIKGRTKLQKTVYFLGLLTGQIENLGYGRHFYGPSSPEVAGAVSTLEGMGFLSSYVGSVGGFDAQGFETRRMDYRLTEEGKAVAEKKAVRNRDLFQKLQKASEALSQAGEPDYVMLAIASKTYFMLREIDALASDSVLERLALRFGWDVSQQQIREAVQYLRKLQLVEAASA